MNNWTYSPDPAVEKAIDHIRITHPADYPTGLERMHAFMAELGNPHRRLPFIFHAAGTNGKGSTLAFLQAILEAGGKSVHKFISPHLIQFEERIILNGRMIGSAQLLQLIAECEKASAKTPVSFFEFFTGLTFLAFSRHAADAILLETGLGGTYDATNIVDGPQLLSLLTRISYDHTHILGKTLGEIAGNKAGIIKHGCTAVVAPQPPEALDVFRRKAAESGAPFSACGDGWNVEAYADHFEYQSTARACTLPLPALLGRHQIDNAGTALAAMEHSPFAHLFEQKILDAAMRNVRWPGRLQRLTEGRLVDLLPRGWELWLDGAHNDSGADTISEQIAAWGHDMPLHLITAMKKTKNAASIYQALLPHITTIQAVDTRDIHAPMTTAEALCDQLQKLGHPCAATTPDLESSLRALSFQFHTPQRILITGSLYLVGRALKENS